MAFRVVVKGLKELQAQFAKIDSSEIPFVTARALTLTAKDAVPDVKTSLPKHFIIRARGKMQQGISFKGASKRNLEAVVFDAKPFMERQETGGVKLPNGHRCIAIPLKGARPTPRSRIKPADLPERVMERGGYIKKGPRGALIMWLPAFRAGRRKRDRFTGQSQGAKWSRISRPMYVLVPRWAVEARYGFKGTVEGTVNIRFRANFKKAFDEARIGK